MKTYNHFSGKAMCISKYLTDEQHTFSMRTAIGVRCERGFQASVCGLTMYITTLYDTKNIPLPFCSSFSLSHLCTHSGFANIMVSPK